SSGAVFQFAPIALVWLASHAIVNRSNWSKISEELVTILAITAAFFLVSGLFSLPTTIIDRHQNANDYLLSGVFGVDLAHAGIDFIGDPNKRAH
ncbi:hypothetical protein ABTC06_19365, partial [Acinetobacter baumannii]